MTRSSYVVILFVMALLVVACGGDGGTSDVTSAPIPDATDQPEQEDDETDSTSAPVDDEPDTAGPVNVATVTVGDMTYEADVTPGTLQRCDPDFFNAFWALGGGVEMFLPPPDDPNHTDAPRVVVKDDTSGLEWIADPAAFPVDGNTVVPEGDSQVDSFNIEGNTASGSATFIEQEEYYQWTGGGDQPKPVKGTFTVTCASD